MKNNKPNGATYKLFKLHDNMKHEIDLLEEEIVSLKSSMKYWMCAQVVITLTIIKLIQWIS